MKSESSASGLTENSQLRPLFVFLCYAREDKTELWDLYHKLRDEGFRPWLDEANLLGGQDWKREIDRTVRKSDVVIVALSPNSLDRQGYFQKEIKSAIDVAEEKPENTIFIIPVRLEECRIPDRLSHLQWIDLFERNQFEKLVKTLNERARALGCSYSKNREEPIKKPILLEKFKDFSFERFKEFLKILVEQQNFNPIRFHTDHDSLFTSTQRTHAAPRWNVDDPNGFIHRWEQVQGIVRKVSFIFSNKDDATSAGIEMTIDLDKRYISLDKFIGKSVPVVEIQSLLKDAFG